MRSIRRFALIGHARDSRHIYEGLRKKYLPTPPFSDETVFRWMEETPPFVADFWPDYLTCPDCCVSGVHIPVPATPEYFARRPRHSLEKIRQAISLAARLGANVITLGGLTSILFRRYQEAAAQQYGVAITSGNTLTAAVTVKMLERAASLRHVDLSKSALAVLGASGDIGSGCCQAFAGRVSQLILVGRHLGRLRDLEEKLRSSYSAACIATCTDIGAAVKNADLVISATSAANLDLDTRIFKRRAIVCDVGYPRNISRGISEGDQPWVFDGGLVKLPKPLPSDWDTGLPSEGVTFGCYAEGMLLTLEGITENYSRGKGHITPASMEQTYALAQKHGFREVDVANAESVCGGPIEMPGVAESRSNE
jgi:fatty aldehyde-generating acyl-ACP reductase